MAGMTYSDVADKDLAGNIAAAMAWWREAGVDCTFADEPARWIAAPEPKPASQAGPLAAPAALPSAPEIPRIAGDPALWPNDLATFQAWWLAEPLFGDGRAAGRVPPRGPAEARLMVLVEQPEDTDTERLLAGPQGALLDQMLAAMGIPADEVFVASALPWPDPLPDWPALGAAGLGDLARHHVQLAAPQRLIVLGSNILPLLGHDLAQTALTLPPLNHEGRTIPVFGERGLDSLARPRAKAGFWRRWLDWTRA